MRRLIVLSLILFSMCAFAKKKAEYVGLKYYKNIFGHVHQNPSRYSNSLTTISCGHPVKVYANPKKHWSRVKVGPHSGFIEKNFLLNKRPKCFQDNYPRFFDQFTLDISELYYWGRLYDHYVQGKSRVQ